MGVPLLFVSPFPFPAKISKDKDEGLANPVIGGVSEAIRRFVLRGGSLDLGRVRSGGWRR